jgi:hypothetical protein
MVRSHGEVSKYKYTAKHPIKENEVVYYLFLTGLAPLARVSDEKRPCPSPWTRGENQRFPKDQNRSNTNLADKNMSNTVVYLTYGIGTITYGIGTSMKVIFIGRNKSCAYLATLVFELIKTPACGTLKYPPPHTHTHMHTHAHAHAS